MMHTRIYVDYATLYEFERWLEFLILNGISFPMTSKLCSWFCPLKLCRISLITLYNPWNIGRQLRQLRLPWLSLVGFFMIINTASTYLSCGIVSSPPNNLVNLPWLSILQLINVSLEMLQIKSETKLSLSGCHTLISTA